MQLRRHLRRPSSFTFEGHEFHVDHGVFDPVQHLSGIAFAEQLADFVYDYGLAGRRALEIGTGCGLLAATLARQQLAVVATDVSDAAVACASANCCDLAVDIRHGDMFTPVEHERFDMVVVNPPYERVRATRRTSTAFTSPDFLERLGARVHDFAPMLLLGFPADDEATLAAAGLDLVQWRSVETSGRTLGLYLSVRPDGHRAARESSR